MGRTAERANFGAAIRQIHPHVLHCCVCYVGKKRFKNQVTARSDFPSEAIFMDGRSGRVRFIG